MAFAPAGALSDVAEPGGRCFDRRRPQAASGDPGCVGGSSSIGTDTGRVLLLYFFLYSRHLRIVVIQAMTLDRIKLQAVGRWYLYEQYTRLRFPWEFPALPRPLLLPAQHRGSAATLTRSARRSGDVPSAAAFARRRDDQQALLVRMVPAGALFPRRQSWLSRNQATRAAAATRCWWAGWTRNEPGTGIAVRLAEEGTIVTAGSSRARRPAMLLGWLQPLNFPGRGMVAEADFMNRFTGCAAALGRAGFDVFQQA